MEYKLIATDLDGTLLDSDRHLPAQNLMALKTMADRGAKVVLASGRSFESVRRIAIENGIDGPIISVNGARIDLSVNGPMLAEYTYPHELAVQVFNIMKQSGIYFTCYGHGTLYQNNLTASRDRTRGVNVKGRLEMQTHRVELVVSDESRTIHEGLINPYKFVAFSEDEVLLGMLRRRLVKSGLPLNISSSWVDNIEVMYERAGKGSALKLLAEYFGIDREQVMAFGDNDNDIPMLEYAGTGVAMENALPDVKAAANVIAPLNDMAGVAHIINKLALGGDIC